MAHELLWHNHIFSWHKSIFLRHKNIFVWHKNIFLWHQLQLLVFSGPDFVNGSNKVLKLMNRKHSVNNYLEIFHKLKNINSQIEFSSDFIISYPGEDENDFKDTLELISEVKFINSYSFVFSPRPGTVASNLPIMDKKNLLKDYSLFKKNYLIIK